MKYKILIFSFTTFLFSINCNSQVTKNKIGDKIYGDFNGDGKFEYAFRVLTKKGFGNPVENGIPDEYELKFSDENIKPIKDKFYWFTLINEGDIDNDGSDEVSVQEDPLNGCIGVVKTFTIKNKKSNYLFEPFSFYRSACDDKISINSQDLVENDNGIVYFYEYNADADLELNGGYTVNSKGKKIFGKKIKAFEVRNIENRKTNDALKNILKSPKTVNSNDNKKFFTGKKKFCDGLKSWYYIVTIDGDNITFESYPDLENNLHKNKTKPFEVVKGKIIGEIIKIHLPENCEDCGQEYETGRFKYENGILYDANIEGGYNDYYECTINNEPNHSKEVLPNLKSNSKEVKSFKIGTGNENNSGYLLGDNRKAIVKPLPEYKCNEEGKVVVQIVVDKNGDVISAIAGMRGTTNKSKCLLDACKEAALKTKWEAKENTRYKKIGSITYNFKISD